MMKKSLLILLMVLLSPIVLFAIEKNDIVGLWFMSEDDAGEIAVAEVFEHDGKYYAAVFAYKSYETTGEITMPVKDVNNPDQSLRNRTLDQVMIVNEISFNGKKWENGEIYDPSVGKYYYLSGTLKEDGAELVWKATIDKAGIFGPKLIWTKVENIAAYQPIRKTAAELEAMISNKRYK